MIIEITDEDLRWSIIALNVYTGRLEIDKIDTQDLVKIKGKCIEFLNRPLIQALKEE